eukprot:Skav225170  [mRNA]  locus=scaffold1095:119822:124345:+ [translate_table: standard]
MVEPPRGMHLMVLSLGESSMRVATTLGEGTLHTDKCWVKQMVIGLELTLDRYRISWCEGEFHIYAWREEGALLFLKPCLKRGRVNAAEVFAGLAGWTSVVDKAGFDTRLIIEKDEDTAKCAAKKFDAPVMTANQYIQGVLGGVEYSLVVLWDDVTSASTWVAVGLANVGLVVGSPPCPPWSTAANAYGLEVEEGQSFMEFLQWTAHIAMPLVIVENVPGILKHADFRLMVQKIEKMGLYLALSGVFNCKHILPLNRDRWIGTFVHTSVRLDAGRVQMANSISFSNRSFSSVSSSPTIDIVDVSHVNMSSDERHDLKVQPHALHAMGNVEFAPQWLKEKVKTCTPEDLIQGRVLNVDAQYKGFMAMYGSQHKLDPKLLASKGLHTVIMQDEQGYRYISPWEMLSAMGYTPCTVLSEDMVKSWRMAGNGIASAHVWLAIYKTHIMLGSESPFVPMLDVSQEIQELKAQGIQLSEFEAVKEEGFWVLKKPTMDEHDDDRNDTKKRRVDEQVVDQTVPPTVPFSLEQVGCTKNFEVAPEFAQLGDPRKIAAAWCNQVGVVAVLQHAEKHWIMIVNGSIGETVADLVTRGLPHAKQIHFHAFKLQGSDAEWSSTVDKATMCNVIFTPVSQHIVVHVPRLSTEVTLQVDVTWTVKTMLAYVATQLQCNPDAIAVMRNQSVLSDQDYLNAYESTEYKLTFKACMPGYVAWDREAKSIQDPGLKPETPGQHRIVARHPMRKVIRTCVYQPENTIAQIIQMLFPDLVASVSWTAHSSAGRIDSNSVIGKLDAFTIQWETLRPMAPTVVEKASLGTPVDSSGNQVCYALGGVRLSIRSPLKVRAADMWCPLHQTLAHIGASFLQQTQANVSMLCESGPRVLDPCTKVSHVNTNDVISFRLCPLLGGGKHDALKNKLKGMLVARGVAEADVAERVTNLLNKVPIEHIAKYKDNADGDFWTKLKDDASDAKFRLITPGELKQFQAKQRKNKGESSRDHAPKKHAKTKNMSIDLGAIQVDMSHFMADDEPVVQLELNRFGPDQTGLCVVPCQDAARVVNSAVKSCDPLALLIVGEGAGQYGQTFSFPAHQPNGEPVIVQAALKQFGDIPIEFVLKLPAVQVEQLESTVLEFSIQKEYVGSWADTAQPMNYLGVHVPPLRGSNLLAAWSIKAFAGNKPTQHGHATHWHGYLRVADSLLSQVLQRSGAAGIFLVPKTSDRRRDPRFVAFPVPGKSLAEVITRAESFSESLGVVRMGDAFGIRCRRDDSSNLRSQLSPESAYVEHATAASDEHLFILRNVPQVSRDELSNALVRMGWNAQALRSQGVSRWLVASKVDPQTTHFIVNHNIVVVEKMQKRNNSGGLHMIASEVKVSTILDPQQGVVSMSTTSRFAEIRAQVEEQISAAVEQKLAQANARIEDLSHSLQQVQAQSQEAQTKLANDVGMVREEQGFTRAKLAEMEGSIATSNQAVLSQMHTMQGMFAKMEESMRQLVQNNNREESFDPEKRARVGDVPKADPFAKSS